MSEDIYEKLSKERKEQQELGLLPEWYTTSGWQMYKQKYLYQADSWKSQIERIAKTAAKHLKGTSLEAQAERKFFELFWNGWLSGSTPVQANMGTDRGLPISCAGNYVDDSINGFYSARKETALLTKWGFGTSAYLGSIRHRGSKISRGGKASGILPVLKGHIQDMEEVSQGNTRRGSWAGYIEIDHGDFDEIVDLTMAEPDGCNIGWIVKDQFIEKLESGNEEALRRFQRAMKLKMVTGRGYFCFIDKINRKRPESYVKHGLTVKASNLCVAPETLILTENGYIEISELEDQGTKIWNGHEWSDVVIKKTSDASELIKVITDCGQELECTKEHIFYIRDRVDVYSENKIRKISACQLRPGDKLIKLITPIIEGSEILDQAYVNGFYTGDGTAHFQDGKFKGHRIYLYHEKRELRDRFANKIQYTVQENQNREYFYVSNLMQKFFVPDAKYTVKSRLDWLAGLLDSDGCLLTEKNHGSECLQICSIEINFLKQIQLMLQTLGIQSKIKIATKAGERMMPANDGSGQKKEFHCKDSWRLLISGTGVMRLHELGIDCGRIKLAGHVPQRNAEGFVKVKSIEYTGRTSPTYCFTEPKRHKGVFNGILTGQCDEITLFSDKDHTFSCVLSSMNDAKWHEWKDTDAVFWATVFLDCVVAEFLEMAKKIPGLENVVRFTEKGRALGLGQCGLHTLFQENMIPFESLQAQMLSQQISKHIWEESLRASKFLAKELGEPEWCKGLGIRNTHRLAIAPTKSSANLIGGVSEGINPDPAMSYTQTGAAGEIPRVNLSLYKIMNERGVFTKKNLKDINDKMGSVQHVTWLTDEEKKVFKTAFEINQEVVLRMASARAQYIDQWQSLNLFVDANEDPYYIAQLHKKAFLDENILGLYYIYTQAGVQASKGEICEACQ